MKKFDFNVEKGFNRTFSNKFKDYGIQQQEKSLSEINLNANDCFIIECTVENFERRLLIE